MGEEDCDSCFDYESNTKSRRLTDFIATRPIASSCGIVALVAILAVVWISGVLNNQFAENGGSYWAVEDIDVQRWLVKYAHDDRPIDVATVPPLSTSKRAYQLMMLHSPTDARATSIFTPLLLKSIWRTERAAMGLDTRCLSCQKRIVDFTRFCQVNVEKLVSEGRPDVDTCSINDVEDCVPPDSPVGLVFGALNISYFDINSEHFDNLCQDAIDNVLNQVSHNDTLEDIGFFFDENFRAVDHPSGTPYPQSLHTRSLLKFGSPVCSSDSDGSQLYKNPFDNTGEQDTAHEAFVKQYTDFFAEGGLNGLETRYSEEILSEHEIIAFINADLMLAVIAGVVIMVCIGIQTGSAFLGFFGLVTVGLAYPVTLFVYHGIYQIEYDTNLNRVSLFIILGIGADDIFIFTDAWKQSLHQGASVTSSVQRRLNWAWLRAAGAMLITSFTTFVALILTATSPLPLIQAFGVFSGTMIVFNYVMVITFYPAIVVVWDRYLAHRRCWPLPALFSRSSKKSDSSMTSTNAVEEVELPEQASDSTNVPVSNAQKGRLAIEAEDEKGCESSKVDVSHEGKDKSVSTGGSSNSDMDTDGAGNASTSSKSSTPEETVDDISTEESSASINADKSSQAYSGSLSTSGTEIAVKFEHYRFIERFFYLKYAPLAAKYRKYIILGFFLVLIAGIAGVAIMEPPLGEDPYEPLPGDAPIIKFFSRLGDFPASKEATNAEPDVFVYYGVNRGDPVDRSGLDPNDEHNFGTVNYDSSFAENFDRAAQDYMSTQICDRIRDERRSDDNKPYVRRGQHKCVIRDFLAWNDNQSPVDNDVTTFSDRMFQFLRNNTDLVDFVGFEFVDDQPVFRYLVLRFSPNFLYSDGFEVGNSWLDAWNVLLDDLNSKAPQGLQGGFHASYQWGNLKSFDLMIASMKMSISISFVVAVAVLLIALKNWIVALLASFSIGGIVITIIGAFTFLGEKCDTVHAIVYVMIVGLSVDFVAHIAHSYNKSRARNRVNRTRDALLEVGVSVLGGALTTTLAGVVLLFGQLRFLLTFGETLFGTVVVAIIWALVAFVALLMQFGPNEAHDGDLRYLYAKHVKKLRDDENPHFYGADSRASKLDDIEIR